MDDFERRRAEVERNEIYKAATEAIHESTLLCHACKGEIFYGEHYYTVEDGNYCEECMLSFERVAR